MVQRPICWFARIRGYPCAGPHLTAKRLFQSTVLFSGAVARVHTMHLSVTRQRYLVDVFVARNHLPRSSSSNSHKFIIIYWIPSPVTCFRAEIHTCACTNIHICFVYVWTLGCRRLHHFKPRNEPGNLGKQYIALPY